MTESSFSFRLVPVLPEFFLLELGAAEESMLSSQDRTVMGLIENFFTAALCPPLPCSAL